MLAALHLARILQDARYRTTWGCEDETRAVPNRRQTGGEKLVRNSTRFLPAPAERDLGFSSHSI